MPDPQPTPTPAPPTPNPTPDPKDQEIADLKAKLAKLQPGDPPPADPDLAEKARKQRELDDKKNNDTKATEDALRFDMGAEQWLKTNQSLLPKDVADIFAAAKKETYDSIIQKDAAVKSGIVKAFFAVQSNLDLLTPAIKNQLEDYLKLTNTGKQEQARQAYVNIFEPAFEMLKRVKKAEALQRGHNSGTDDALIEKRIGRATKHFLGEK